MTGALISSTAFDPEYDDFHSCETVSVISPGGDPLVGCAACNRKWRVRIRELTSTCGEWTNHEDFFVNVGINFEEAIMYLNHDQGDGWVEYGGDGDINEGNSGFIGGLEGEPRPTDEGTYTSSETFLVNW